MSTPSSPPQDVFARRSSEELVHTSSLAPRRPPLHALDHGDGPLVPPREVVGNILSSDLSGSPLSRAGYDTGRDNILIFAHSIDNLVFRLLQYNYHSTPSAPRPTFFPRSQNDIRAHTMQLSNVAVSSKTSPTSPLPTPSPYNQSSSNGVGSQTPRMPPAMSQCQPSPGDIPSSFKSAFLEAARPNLTQQYQTTTPSGLSLLLANRRAEVFNPSSRGEGPPSSPGTSPSLTPQPRVDFTTSPPPVQTNYPERPSHQLSEGAPLLAQRVDPTVSYSSVEAGLPHPIVKSGLGFKLASASKIARVRSGELLVTCVRSLPAVLLGVLLNILDGVSCESLRECPKFRVIRILLVRWFDYIPYLGHVCRSWRSGSLHVLRIVSVRWPYPQERLH